MTLPAAPVPFPWRDVMSFGLGRLGWPPQVFWAATPREIVAALHAHQKPGTAGATDHDALARLMAAHPDR